MRRFNCDFSSRFRILKGGKISLVVSALLGSAIIASAAPTGGTVTSGDATIIQSGNITNVNQTTNKASINWQNFNVSSTETVNFNQPNVNSITLNRVVGNEKSVIDGTLNANGQVWILNSNGILFNSNAKINTSGLLATTAELSDKDFQDGNYNFKNSKSNAVVNLGTIDVSNGGYVVLASNEVRNSGTIKAVRGKVYLSGNSEYTINLNGNSIVNLIVTKGVLDAMVENSGTIIANGGEVYLSTNAVNELLKGVVNNIGVIEANSLDDVTGKVEVYAHGGTANIGGTIDASAPVSGDGGFIETSGKKVNITADAKITTKSKNGKTGTWLIDPNDFTVASSGGNITGTQLSSNLSSNNIQISTATQGTTGGNGDIFVNDNVSWSSGNTLTLTAERNININSTIDASSGSGGKVVLEYGQGAVASGNTASYTTGTTGKINLQAGQKFSTKLGSNGTQVDYTVVTTKAGITGMSLTGNYALGGDLTSFGSMTPIGSLNTGTPDVSTAFSGKFDGLGHSISGLTISIAGTSTQYNTGLFGATYGATISNLKLVSPSVQATAHSYIGSLVGYSINSIISNIAISGAGTTIKSVYGSNGYSNYGGSTVGGLIGYALGTSISDSSVSSATIVAEHSNVAGGLVGQLDMGSTINNSYVNSSNISSTLDGGNYGYIAGGLVGNTNGSTISNSYTTNSTIQAQYQYAGGLVGSIDAGISSTTISNSYSMGNNITTRSYAGSLTGNLAKNSVVSDSYASGNTLAQYSTYGLSNFGGLFGYVNSDEVPSITNSFYKLSDTSIKGSTNVLTWGGLFDTEYTSWINSSRVAFSPSTNSSSPFTISNVNDFKQALAYIYTPNVQLKLGSNITLSSGLFFPALYGTLDGGGYTISGLNVNQTNSNLGFVNYLIGGTIKNLTLSSPTITGQDKVGALVGESLGGVFDNTTQTYTTGSKSTITDVNITGATVGGSNYVGGLVGYSKDTAISNIDITSSSMTGSMYVGGGIGWATKNSSIDNLVSHGNTVAASDTQSGGIVGRLDYTSSINNSGSYSNTISATRYYTGGIAGYLSQGISVSNSYAYGNTLSMLNSDAFDIGGLFGYIDSSTVGLGAFTNNFYKVSNTSIQGSTNVLTFGGLFDTEFNTWFTTNSRAAFTPSTNSSSPFVINNETEFKEALAYAYTSGVQLKLGADITLSSGVYMPALYGTLDGNNHTISGLNVTQSYNSHLGLIGYLVGGTVKNISVDTPTLTGYSTVGGLVGESSASTWDTSLNSGSGGFVSSTGSSILNSSVTNFTNSWTNARAISSYSKVGGAVGFANDYTTLNNVSTAGSFTITANQTGNGYGNGNGRNISNIGGLVGNTGNGVSISNSNSSIGITLNAGVQNFAYVTFDGIGGLVGRFGYDDYSGTHISTLENSSSTGNIAVSITPYAPSSTSTTTSATYGRDDQSTVYLYNIGGYIGQAVGVNFDNLTASNTVTISSSNPTATNNRTSMTMYNIGGLVGQSTNSIYGATTAVSNSGALTINVGTGYNTNIGYYTNYGIGGFVGTSNYDTFTKASTSANINITDVNTNRIHALSPNNYNGASNIYSIGGLVGLSNWSNYNASTVTSTGDITISQTLASGSTGTINYIGGLIGYSNIDTIDGASSSGTITITAPKAEYIGGISGYLYWSNLANASSSVAIDGTNLSLANYVGGIAGKIDGGVQDLFYQPLFVYEQYYDNKSYADYQTEYTSKLNAFSARSDVQALVAQGYNIVDNDSSYNYSSSYYSPFNSKQGYLYYFALVKPNYRFGDISNVTASGNITLNHDANYVGGITGKSSVSKYTNVSSSGNISITNSSSASYIGGLIGDSAMDTIADSTSTSAISITSPTISYVGGLLGNAAGYTQDDYFSYGGGSGYILDGQDYQTIHDNAQSIYEARSDVQALLAQGYSLSDWSDYTTNSIFNTYTLYFYMTKSNHYGSITNSTSSSTGTITLNGNSDYVGGLVGNSSLMEYSGNTVAKNISITGTSVNYVGGLTGMSISDIITNESPSQTISITGTNVQYIGGLVGYNKADNSIDSIISNSHVSSNLNITNASYLGGLVGYNDSTSGIAKIYQSYTTNNVTGKQYVGGLVGKNAGTVEQSYASGTVTASGDYVGGLVGINTGTILNTYAIGNVTGASNIGGLVGSSTAGTITNSYAANTTTGTSNIGGLIGSKSATTVNASYFDKDINSGRSDAGTYGQTTATLQDVSSSIYSTWDMDNTGTLTSNPYANLTMGGSKIWKLPPAATLVTYTLSAITGYTYSGSAVTLNSLWSTSSIFGNTYSSWLLGTDYNFTYAGNTITSFTNAGTYSNIGISVLKSGFTTASSGNTNGSLAIDKKALTISGLTSANKTYDGTTTADVNGTAVLQTSETAGSGTTSDGKAYTGDTVSLTGTAAGTFNSKDVASATTVSFSGLSLTGAQSGNYTLTPHATVSNTISAKALTISGLTSANKTYDGTTTADVNGTAVLQTSETAGSGTTSDGKAYTGDTVSLTGTAAGTFNSKDVASATTVSFSGLSLTGAQSGNYTLTPHATVSNTISAKALTISGLTSANKTYDGTTTADVNGTAVLQTSETAGSGTTSDGKAYTGDTVSLTGTAAGTFNSKDVASATTVSFSGLSLTGAQSGNYTLTPHATVSNTISAKALTISGLTSANKTYDGTTTADVNGTAVLQTSETAGSGTTSDGKAYTGDTVSLTGTAAGTFNSKDVASATTVSFSGLSLTGAQSGNYTLTPHATVSNTISAKALTISGLTSANKTYDGTTTADVNGTAVLQTSETAGSGTTSDGKAYTGDTVSLTGTAAGTFNSKDVASATTVSFSGLSLTGAQSGNYTLTPHATVSNTISAKALTISGLTSANKTYDGTTTADVNGTAVLQTSETAGSGTTSDGKAYTGDTVSLTGTAAGTFNSKDVASATTVSFSGLSLTGAQSGNYTLTPHATVSNTISAKALTISGLTSANKTYDGTTTADVNGTAVLQTSETAGSGTTSDGKAYTGDTVSLTGTAAGTFNSKDVASATTVSFSGLSLTGAQSGNYTLTPHATVSNTISAKALTISGLTSANKTYDGTTTADVNGTAVLQTSETAGSGTTSDGKAYTGDTVSLTGTAAGTFNSKDVASATTVSFSGLSLTGAQSGNYTLTPHATVSNTISAKALTISGLTSANKTYDGTTTADVNGTAVLQTSETAGSGTTSDGKAYTGDTVSLTGTAAGTFNSKDVASATTVSFSGLSLTGAQSGNYTLTPHATVSNTISAKALTISGLTSANKTYDGTTTADVNGTAVLQTSETAGSGTTSDGKAYTGDTVSLTGTAAGTFNSKDVASATTVSFSGLSLTGAQSGNYTLTPHATVSNTISAKALTISGLTSANKTYDGTTTADVNGTAVLQTSETAGSGTTSDGKAYTGDTVSLTGTAAGTFNSKDVASATTVSFSGLSLTGAQSGNYTLTPHATVSNTISAKALTISGLTSANKTYDGTTTADVNGTAVLQTSETAGSGTTSDGKAYTGDTVSLTGTAAGTFNSKDVASATTVSFSGLSLTGAQSGNYTLTPHATVSNTISAKALTISGLTSANKTYDGTTTADVNGTAVLQTSETAGSGTTSDGKAYTGDTVSLTGTAAGTFNSKDVASATTVSFSGLSLTGAQSGNYTLTPHATVSNTISAKALTISGLTSANKTYDGTTTADVNGTAVLQTSETAGSGTTSDGKAYTGDTVSLTGTAAGTFNSKDVASATTVSFSGLSLTGAQSGNYTLTPHATVSNTISARTLTVNGLTISSKIYDGSNSATVSSAGIIDNVNGDDVSFSTIATFNNKNVEGSKTVNLNYTLSGTDASNYLLVDETNISTSALINPKILTVSGLTIGSKIYDGSNLATVSNEGFIDKVSGDNVDFSTIATFNNSNVEGSKTVNLDYTLSGTDAVNYSLVDETNVTTNALINPKSTTAQVILKTSEVTGIPLKLDGILNSELVSQGAKIVVLDASNNDVTELALLGKIQPGKYSVKAINQNTNYSLTSNTVELTINPALDPITVVKVQPIVVEITVPKVEVKSTPVQVNQNIGLKLGVDSGSVNLVSQTIVGQPNQVVTLSELKTLSQENSNTTEKKEVKLEDVRVSLNQNSIVQIVNGGVLLPSTVDQQFYVVKDMNVNNNSSSSDNSGSSNNKTKKRLN